MSEQLLEDLELPRGRFQTPPHLRDDNPDPDRTTVEESPSPSESGPPGPPAPSADGTSTTSATPATARELDPARRQAVAAELGLALVGLLAIGVSVGRWVARRRNLELREPSKAEYQAVGVPLGRIASRHLSVEVAPAVVKDVYDLGLAAGGVSNYLLSTPAQKATWPDEQEEGQDDETAYNAAHGFKDELP